MSHDDEAYPVPPEPDFTPEFDDNAIEQTLPLREPMPANLLIVRRTLKAFLAQHHHTIADLETLRAGKTLSSGAPALAVIAAIAMGRRYPFDDENDRRYKLLLDKAQRGELNSFAGEAMDEVGGLIAIVKKSLIGLDTLDAIGAPLPATWGNLSADQLARGINQHCLIVLGNALITR
jgi:hypothetical protein